MRLHNLDSFHKKYRHNRRPGCCFFFFFFSQEFTSRSPKVKHKLSSIEFYSPALCHQVSSFPEGLCIFLPGIHGLYQGAFKDYKDLHS